MLYQGFGQTERDLGGLAVGRLKQFFAYDSANL